MLDPNSARRVEIDLIDKDIVYLIGQRYRLAAGLLPSEISPQAQKCRAITRVVQHAVDSGAPVYIVENTYKALLEALDDQLASTDIPERYKD